MSKYGYLLALLKARGLLAADRSYTPAPMKRAQIALAHETAYVDRVFDGALSDAEIRRIGLPYSPALVRRTRLSSAGTTLAAWLALEHGIACNAAGGSHHAGPAYGSGFCVFNDVAIAIENLIAQGVGGRFLVLDADVHQGDGTARIFADRDNVVTVSVHSEKNFPARKAISTVDVALPDGMEDDDYLATLRETLTGALDLYAPSLVFYNAGVDVHRDDRLGRLALSDAGLRRREALVIGAVRARDIPLVGVLGGGYAHDPRIVAERHAILFEEAAKLAP